MGTARTPTRPAVPPRLPRPRGHPPGAGRRHRSPPRRRRPPQARGAPRGAGRARPPGPGSRCTAGNVGRGGGRVTRLALARMDQGDVRPAGPLPARPVPTWRGAVPAPGRSYRRGRQVGRRRGAGRDIHRRMEGRAPPGPSRVRAVRRGPVAPRPGPGDHPARQTGSRPSPEEGEGGDRRLGAPVPLHPPDRPRDDGRAVVGADRPMGLHPFPRPTIDAALVVPPGPGPPRLGIWVRTGTCPSTPTTNPKPNRRRSRSKTGRCTPGTTHSGGGPAAAQTWRTSPGLRTPSNRSTPGRRNCSSAPRPSWPRKPTDEPW